MFILCTYLDGPYWKSGLEPLLYPTGCSFYRPFSYRGKYISPNLLATFNDSVRLNNFLFHGSQRFGIFGLRFTSKSSGEEFENRFIPLRIVCVTNIEIHDEFHIFIKFGNYISLNSDGNFRVLDLGEVLKLTSEPIQLMVSPPEDTQVFSRLNQFIRTETLQTVEPPRGIWDALTSDPSISPKCKSNLSGATILRLRNVKRRGDDQVIEPTKLKPRSLHETGKEDYGYNLKVGKIYDFNLAFNTLGPPASAEKFNKGEFTFNSPEDYFETSATSITISGNYRHNSTWVRPKIARPAVHTIDWVETSKVSEPTEFEIVLSDNNQETGGSVASMKLISSKEEVNLVGIKVPVTTYAPIFSVVRVVYLLLAFVFGYLAYLSFDEAFRSVATNADKVYIGIATFFAVTSGAFFQAFIKSIIDEKFA